MTPPAGGCVRRDSDNDAVVGKNLVSTIDVSLQEYGEMLMKNFKGRAANKLSEIEKLLVEYRFEIRFPGKALLTKAKELLTKLFAGS